MYSLQEQAYAIANEMKALSYRYNFIIFEFQVPGEREKSLRISVYKVDDSMVDKVESDIYDISFDLEKRGYPGRVLVSVYRPEESSKMLEQDSDFKAVYYVGV